MHYIHFIHVAQNNTVPVVPARGWAEVALRIYYKTFHIYRTCMRRAPVGPARARCVRVCCTVAFQEDLRATTLQCNAKRRLSSHFTMASSHPALYKPHFISAQATLQQLFYTQQTFTQRSFSTQKPEALAHRSFLHTEAFTQRRFYTQQPSTHSKLLYTANFDTEKPLHTEALQHSSSEVLFYTKKLLHEAFTQISF